MSKKLYGNSSTEVSTFSQTMVSNLKELLSGPKNYYYLIVLCALGIFIASMFSANALHIGYHHVYGVYREIPWGILISGYIFFVAISTGLTIISCLGHFFGVKVLEPIAKRAVYLAIVTVSSGFIVIFFDLENPFRMLIWNVFSPNFTSNIWWMGTLYGIFLFITIIEFILVLINEHKYSSLAGFLGLIAEVMAISNLGAVFGMLRGRDFWYGPFIPYYLVATAGASGCAALIFFTYLGYKIMSEKMEKSIELSLQAVGKIWGIFLAILMFMIFWNVITGLVGSEGKAIVFRELLFGKYAINFWLFEIGFGIVIPLFLLIIANFRNLNQMFVASIFALIGILFMRYDMVVLGQIVSHYFEFKVTDFPVILNYSPTIYEIMVIVGAMSFCFLAFLIGERVFKGHRSEIH